MKPLRQQSHRTGARRSASISVEPLEGRALLSTTAWWAPTSPPPAATSTPTTPTNTPTTDRGDPDEHADDSNEHAGDTNEHADEHAADLDPDEFIQPLGKFELDPAADDPDARHDADVPARDLEAGGAEFVRDVDVPDPDPGEPHPQVRRRPEVFTVITSTMARPAVVIMLITRTDPRKSSQKSPMSREAEVGGNERREAGTQLESLITIASGMPA